MADKVIDSLRIGSSIVWQRHTAVFILALYQALSWQLPLAMLRTVNDARAWYTGRYENSRVISSKQIYNDDRRGPRSESAATFTLVWDKLHPLIGKLKQHGRKLNTIFTRDKTSYFAMILHINSSLLLLLLLLLFLFFYFFMFYVSK